MTVTMAGLPLPVITITANQNLGKPLNKREGILVSARVHPGETNSSYVLEGFLKLITV